MQGKDLGYKHIAIEEAERIAADLQDWGYLEGSSRFLVNWINARYLNGDRI